MMRLRSPEWSRLLVGLVALWLAGLALFFWTLAQAGLGPIHLTIGGVEHVSGLDFAQMPADLRAALVFLACVAGLVALLLVPTLLLAVTLVAALALLAGVGLPVAGVLLLVGLLLASLIGLGSAGWWMLRRLYARRNGEPDTTGGGTTIGG